MADLNELAADYLELGFFPVPVYGVGPHGCGCGRADCKAPGKHPVGAAWEKRAPRSLDAVRDAFATHQGNIGLCVKDTPFVLLDFDGAEGMQTLWCLEEEGLIVQTLRARTGSGGAHLFYRLAQHQDPRAITDRKAGPKFDVKKNGQAVVFPSVHASGQSYEWTTYMPPATLPDALYDRIKRPVAIVSPAPSPLPASNRFERARAYVAKMPPAIQGSDGSGALWNVARKCIQDFGLSSGETASIIAEYNGRCVPPWSKSEIDHKIRDAERAHTANPIQDRPPPGVSSPPPVGHAPAVSWKAGLKYKHTRTGAHVMLSHAHNIMRILTHDPAWKGRIRFDAFRSRVEVVSPPWADIERPANAEPNWTDEDTTRTASWLEAAYHDEGLSPAYADIERAVAVVARTNAYHPVRDYLDGLTWDGVDRIAIMAVTYFGADDTPFNRMVFEWWMISAVARVYRPGCKADYVLILEGETGIMKSTALGALAGEWFSDTEIDLNSKDAYQQIKGKWIVELGELHTLVKSSDSRAKAFFSSRSDDYRASYERHAKENPRQCVFAGTTNEKEYLVDPTGNRRFWPVACRKADAEAIRRDRDQLWAQARDYFRQERPWWPTSGEALEGAREAQDDRTTKDAWVDTIGDYVARQGLSQVALGQIMSSALGLDPVHQTMAVQKRCASILLHRLGWEKSRVRTGGTFKKVYVKKS